MRGRESGFERERSASNGISFAIERKMFRISLEGEGKEAKVRLEESRSRLRVAIVLDKADASTLLKCLESLMAKGKAGPKSCTFRGRRVPYLIERASNNRGSYFRILELGSRRSPLALFIPQGYAGRGWDTFLHSLVSVLKLNEDAGFATDNAIPPSEGHKLSFADVLRRRPSTFVEDLADRWERVVVCELEADVDWNRVGYAIAKARRVRGKVSVYPFKRRAGLFFVGSVAEVLSLQKRGQFFMEKGLKIIFKKWTSVANSCLHEPFRKGWITLRGLPFHLWSRESLVKILEPWGRVLQVDEATEKTTILHAARVRVALHEGEELPAVLQVQEKMELFIVPVWVEGVESELTRGVAGKHHSIALSQLGGRCTTLKGAQLEGREVGRKSDRRAADVMPSFQSYPVAASNSTLGCGKGIEVGSAEGGPPLLKGPCDFQKVGPIGLCSAGLVQEGSLGPNLEVFLGPKAGSIQNEARGSFAVQKEARGLLDGRGLFESESRELSPDGPKKGRPVVLKRNLKVGKRVKAAWRSKGGDHTKFQKVGSKGWRTHGGELCPRAKQLPKGGHCPAAHCPAHCLAVDE